MAVHDRPRCWMCLEVVDYDPIFSAVCDHEQCPSAVFHGICLMEWREYREARIKAMKKWASEHAEDE